MRLPRPPRALSPDPGPDASLRARACPCHWDLDGPADGLVPVGQVSWMDRGKRLQCQPATRRSLAAMAATSPTRRRRCRTCLQRRIPWTCWRSSSPPSCADARDTSSTPSCDDARDTSSNAVDNHHPRYCQTHHSESPPRVETPPSTTQDREECCFRLPHASRTGHLVNRKVKMLVNSFHEIIPE